MYICIERELYAPSCSVSFFIDHNMHLFLSRALALLQHSMLRYIKAILFVFFFCVLFLNAHGYCTFEGERNVLFNSNGLVKYILKFIYE